MNRLMPPPLLLFLCVVTSSHAQDTSPTPISLPPIQVFFSTKGGCTEAVVRELRAAKTGVFVQTYSFTSTFIAKAMPEVRKRGVPVEVILEVRV